MYKYVKSLPYPVDIKRKDLKMAKYIITQYGGPNGELGAFLRYFSQKFTMPDEKGRSMLNDISVEEMGHAEMICTMVYQLMDGATIEELEKAGLEGNFVEHGHGVFPTDSNGVPFKADFVVTADPLADIAEDMAAEQKARATYENLINVASDPDVIAPLLFLRQREIVHYHRFKELFEYYEKMGY